MRCMGGCRRDTHVGVARKRRGRGCAAAARVEDRVCGEQGAVTSSTLIRVKAFPPAGAANSHAGARLWAEYSLILHGRHPEVVAKPASQHSGRKQSDDNVTLILRDFWVRPTRGAHQMHQQSPGTYISAMNKIERERQLGESEKKINSSLFSLGSCSRRHIQLRSDTSWCSSVLTTHH